MRSFGSANSALRGKLERMNSLWWILNSAGLGNMLMFLTLIVAIYVAIRAQRLSRDTAELTTRFMRSERRPALRSEIEKGRNSEEVRAAASEALRLLDGNDRDSILLLFYSNPCVPLGELSELSADDLKSSLLETVAKRFPERFDAVPLAECAEELRPFAHLRSNHPDESAKYVWSYLLQRLASEKPDYQVVNALRRSLEGRNAEVPLFVAESLLRGTSDLKLEAALALASSAFRQAATDKQGWGLVMNARRILNVMDHAGKQAQCFKLVDSSALSIIERNEAFSLNRALIHALIWAATKSPWNIGEHLVSQFIPRLISNELWLRENADGTNAAMLFLRPASFDDDWVLWSRRTSRMAPEELELASPISDLLEQLYPEAERAEFQQHATAVSMAFRRATPRG